MAWVRLDDQFTDHPKIAAAGPVAGWVYVSGLCYAARYLTDGFVPETIALRFAGSSPEVLANLVECSLWDRVNGGYLIHDFLEYNPPASKVKAEREAAKARMKGNRQGNVPSSPEVRPKFSRTSSEVQPSPSPSPNDDDEKMKDDDLIISELTAKEPQPADPKEQALQALQEFGLFNQPMLAQFNDIWPELAGRQDWVGKAVTIARDKGASSPAYPLKVLLNAVHTNKAPGARNGNDPKRMAETQTDYDALKARYAPKHLEELIEH